MLTFAIICLTLLSTSIIYTANLHSIQQALSHDSSMKDSAASLPDWTWDESEVTLAFVNNLLPITSVEWAAIIPEILRSPEKSDQKYVISMHQQLYCLNLLRIAYLHLHAVESEKQPASYDDVDICVEQLRQHILCNADITLEPTVLVQKGDGLKYPGSTGEGVLHRCEDWQKLDLILDHRLQ